MSAVSFIFLKVEQKLNILIKQKILTQFANMKQNIVIGHSS